MAYDLSEVKVKDGQNWSSPKEIHKIANDYYLYAPVGASGGLGIKDGMPYQVSLT